MKTLAEQLAEYAVGLKFEAVLFDSGVLSDRLMNQRPQNDRRAGSTVASIRHYHDLLIGRPRIEPQTEVV